MPQLGPVLLLLLAAAAAPATAAELAALRQEALELVNRDRAAHGLPALTSGQDLDEAAQAHAQDMQRRDYYAHRSPEGEEVQDRYWRAGGSRSSLVAENIAQCRNCPPPVGPEMLATLQQGWMESPGHRANILARGLERLGFGLAGAGTDDGPLYAVQTFAGPGVPRGLGPDEEPRPLAPGEAVEALLPLLNEARAEAGAPALQASPPLSKTAQALRPEQEGGRLTFAADLGEALPQDERGRWQSIAAIAGACTGCGAEPAHQDLRFFRQEWLGNPQYRQSLLDPALTRLGFALQADGEGGKTAVAILGEPR